MGYWLLVPYVVTGLLLLLHAPLGLQDIRLKSTMKELLCNFFDVKTFPSASFSGQGILPFFWGQKHGVLLTCWVLSRMPPSAPTATRLALGDKLVLFYIAEWSQESSYSFKAFKSIVLALIRSSALSLWDKSILKGLVTPAGKMGWYCHVILGQWKVRESGVRIRIQPACRM